MDYFVYLALIATTVTAQTTLNGTLIGQNGLGTVSNSTNSTVQNSTKLGPVYPKDGGISISVWPLPDPEKSLPVKLKTLLEFVLPVDPFVEQMINKTRRKRMVETDADDFQVTENNGTTTICLYKNAASGPFVHETTSGKKIVSSGITRVGSAASLEGSGIHIPKNYPDQVTILSSEGKAAHPTALDTNGCALHQHLSGYPNCGTFTKQVAGRLVYHTTRPNYQLGAGETCRTDPKEFQLAEALFYDAIEKYELINFIDAPTPTVTYTSGGTVRSFTGGVKAASCKNKDGSNGMPGIVNWFHNYRDVSQENIQFNGNTKKVKAGQTLPGGCKNALVALCWRGYPSYANFVSSNDGQATKTQKVWRGPSSTVDPIFQITYDQNRNTNADTIQCRYYEEDLTNSQFYLFEDSGGKDFFMPTGYICLARARSTQPIDHSNTGSAGRCDSCRLHPIGGRVTVREKDCTFSGLGATGGNHMVISQSPGGKEGVCSSVFPQHFKPIPSGTITFHHPDAPALGQQPRILVSLAILIGGFVFGAFTGFTLGGIFGGKGASVASTQAAIDRIEGVIRKSEIFNNGRFTQVVGEINRLKIGIKDLTDFGLDTRSALLQQEIHLFQLSSNSDIHSEMGDDHQTQRERIISQLSHLGTVVNDTCWDLRIKCDQKCVSDLSFGNFTHPLLVAQQQLDFDTYDHIDGVGPYSGTTIMVFVLMILLGIGLIGGLSYYIYRRKHR